MSPAELRAALEAMRAAWPIRWPGLPQVLGACWARLALPDLDKGLEHPARRGSLQPAWASLRALGLAAAALARRIEDEGRDRVRNGCECAYHHRLHTADVLVSVTALLAQGPRPQARIKARLLLAALIHDASHLCRMNRAVFEQELRAFGRSLDLLRSHGVSTDDLHALEQLLMATEPRWVGTIHALARRRPFDLQHLPWQAVLLTEADILASVLPGLGESLTRSLSREWQSPHPEASRRLLEPQARADFLRRAAHFSSPASHQLGLPQAVSAELQSLGQAA